MSAKVTLDQLQKRLPELLDWVVQTGEEYVVQRHGQDYAVLVSARHWRRRKVAQGLDALGPAYVLPPHKQARAEELLEAKQKRSLAPAERRELNSLLRECDATSALEHQP